MNRSYTLSKNTACNDVWDRYWRTARNDSRIHWYAKRWRNAFVPS